MITRHKLARLTVGVVLATSAACGTGSDDDGAGAGDTAAGANAVSISDFAYRPAEIRVAAGTTVTFTNDDGFAHTVTAEDRSYDSKSLDEGQSFEHTYDEAGTYEYFCAIHNSMTGSVVVE